MTDLISRADALKAMAVIRTDRGHGLAFGIKCVSRVKKDTVGVRCSCNNGMGCRANIASPKGQKGDNMTLIKQEYAIKEIESAMETSESIILNAGLACAKGIIASLPSAEAVSREECDECKTDKEGVLLQQLAELQGDYETMKNAYEDALADAEWIPCNTQMPDELEAVNVTWVNHLAPPYYKHIEGVPFVDSAVYYRGKWYWWDATVIDVLAEYGEDCNAEQIDKDIEILAWMPLPTPYKGGDDE